MIDLREGEEILKIVRQHRSVMSGAIVWPVILTGLVLWVFVKFNVDLFGYSWQVVVGIILIATLVILYKISLWRKNILIITNQRLILDARPGIFSRTVTELLYRDIQGISFEQVGLSALINRYGKLIIKTPSGSDVTFDKVPSPAEIVKTINEIRGSISSGRHPQSSQNESD